LANVERDSPSDRVVKDLLDLVEIAPRCRCGGNCETLQFLAAELTRRQVKDTGWR